MTFLASYPINKSPDLKILEPRPSPLKSNSEPLRGPRLDPARA
jgi:hypothetical protein